MRRLLIATILLLLALPAASALAADRPRDLLIDACRDEKVDGTYSQRTYRRALDQLPADSDQYTACRDVINRARLAALNAGRGGGGDGSGGGSAPSASAPTGGCQGCNGSGTALDTATPDEQKGVHEAAAGGAQPVRVGGRLLRPGAVGSLSSDANSLPTPLVALLVALGLCVLAGAGVAGWNRVLARRLR